MKPDTPYERSLRLTHEAKLLLSGFHLNLMLLHAKGLYSKAEVEAIHQIIDRELAQLLKEMEKIDQHDLSHIIVIAIREATVTVGGKLDTE